MIPRLKPFLGVRELAAVLRPGGLPLAQFETAFARTFEAADAIAFPYGRSALWTFFKGIGLQGAEVIQPAYSCVVVAHATVLSGNVPRFVDVTLDDYNMDLDQVDAAITPNTGAIIATHLFGYPLDIDRLAEVVRRAEARYGRKIWIVQDCAHSFGARWRGRLVCGAGDAAIFGLGISKLATSILGGMLTTNDEALGARLRAWRDANFSPATLVKDIARRIYLLAVWLAFQDSLYGVVRWLQDETPLLDRFTKAYHLDRQIHFPPDYLQQMCGVEARVGQLQLARYGEIVRRREEHARAYDSALRQVPCLALPPIVEGATYSHYVVRVADRDALVRALCRRGVQLGTLIDYSIPHRPEYQSYSGDRARAPNSLLCSQQAINLPVHASLRAAERDRICRELAMVRGARA